MTRWSKADALRRQATRVPAPTNPHKEAGNRIGWPLRISRTHLSIDDAASGESSMSGPISIESLIELLRRARPDAEVAFDFPGFQVPTSVHSYRGYYNRPAIGHERRREERLASDLVKELSEAISGQEYTGWKGGEYTYTRAMPLYVANPGDTSDVLVTGVEDEGWRLVIRTAYHEGFYQ